VQAPAPRVEDNDMDFADGHEESSEEEEVKVQELPIDEIKD
jgi:hypothetical protein